MTELKGLALSSPDIFSRDALDIEALLQPIPGCNPAGVDPKHTGLHEAIKGPRCGIESWQSPAYSRTWADLKSPEFAPEKVMHAAADVLIHGAKDLQVAAWLVESLVMQRGSAGLRDGLRLVRELLDRFWPSLFPSLDEIGRASCRERV